MRHLALWTLAAFAAACNPGTTDVAVDTDTDSDTVDTDTDTVVVETDTEVDTDIPLLGDGQGVGHIFFSHQLRGLGDTGKIRVRAIFADDLGDLPLPVPCLFEDAFCFDALPTVPDQGIDLGTPDYPELPNGSIDVGETLTLSNSIVLERHYRGRYDTDDTDGSGPTLERPYYFTTLDDYPIQRGTLQFTVGGAWGDEQFRGVNLIDPIDPTAPTKRVTLQLRPGAMMPFTWETGGGGDVYLWVDIPEHVSRLYLLQDDGSFELPVDELGDVSTGTWEGRIYLLRMSALTSVRGDATVVSHVMTHQSWIVQSLPRSCGSIHVSDPAAPDGVYTIYPDGVVGRNVYCDMTIDGGGWTLVASSNTTFDDQRASFSTNLATLTPPGSMTGLWDGMRAVMREGDTDSDIRFACRTSSTTPFTVDLSFRRIHWYWELTAGTDATVCFNEADGAGYDRPAPARRNNVNGRTKPLGDDWNVGFLEGEDSCGSSDDFTVDFDDRGMDSNQSDGTDWGEDDSTKKCGTSGVASGFWYIFFRE